MPSGVLEGRDFETYLKEMGLIGGKGVKICDTMDSAMEWMEEQILTAHGVSNEQKEKLLALKDFSLFREFSEEQLSSIKECVSEVSLKREQKLFSTGESGDEMFLVRRAGVRILLPIAGGKYRHLATVSQGGFFRGTGFYR
jgi:SulP family sulfate permease